MSDQSSKKSANESEAEDSAASDTEDDTVSNWSDGSNHDDISDSEDDEGVPPTGYNSPTSRKGDAACVGRAFYQAESEMDEWVARHQDGFSQRLFLLDGQPDGIITPPGDVDKNCLLLDLPQEIRNRIYLFCMPKSLLSSNKFAAPSYITGLKHPKPLIIEIDQKLTGLARLVEASLFQVCRQVRHEGLQEILDHLEVSISWLPSMAKFARFLGKEARAMVRCLSLWDHLDMKTFDTDIYLSCLKEVEAFPRLQDLILVIESHVRDTLDCTLPLYTFYIRRQEEAEKDETQIDDGTWIDPGHLGACWPEFSILQRIVAQDFTLVVESRDSWFPLQGGDVFEGLVRTMQWNSAVKTDLLLTTKTLAVVLDPATDPQAKTIPLYNFVRRLLDDATYKVFPFASPSTGMKVQGCALCYLAQDHCGYHDLPILYQKDADRNEFETLNYTEMRNIAHEAAEGLVNGIYKDTLAKVFIAMDFIGWPEVRDKDKHDLIDKCVDGGYKGAKGDKEGITVWDTMVRALAKAQKE